MGSVIRCRGKKVVRDVSGKRTSWKVVREECLELDGGGFTWAPSVEACWRRAIIREMVSSLFEVRWTGPIWAAASLRMRGMAVIFSWSRFQLVVLIQMRF